MGILFARADLVRLAGLAVWLSVGSFLPLCTDPFARPLPTAIAYLGFGLMFWASSSPRLDARPGLAVGLLAGQSLTALFLMTTHPYFLMTGLLIIVGWQAALRLPMRLALGWMLFQALGAGILLIDAIPPALLLSSLAATIGFQIFALACADLARSERRTRQERDAALAHLSAAQADLMARERQDERLRIARDLHDELGHGLTALGLAAASAELAAVDDAARQRAARLKQDASELLGRVRDVVSTLRETSADEGGQATIDLAQALRAFCAGAHGSLTLALDIAGDPGQVDTERGVALLRLVQEATTNALRHAGPQATTVTVQLKAAADRLDICVSDDGAGAERVVFGHGLTGMRERLKALGGQLSVEAMPGQGWRVAAELPVRAA